MTNGLLAKSLTALVLDVVDYVKELSPQKFINSFIAIYAGPMS